MGRLFWKFFLIIWLAQLAGMVGTGIVFWLDRQDFEAQLARHAEALPPRFAPPMMDDGHPPPPRRPPNRSLPVVPILAGLLASLLSAFGLAWYIAKPVRQLRGAFEAVAEGNLEVRIGDRMGRRRDELADLGHDFDRMSSRLQALMDSQRRLLHDVSHELRSPLARLHAAIGLVRQQPARLEDSLLRIEREGERMNRLVGELLTLSRLEAGVAAPLEEVDLAELIADLLEDIRFEATGRHVAVNCQNMPNFWVQANAALLHRAIENVMRNALRFSPDGGVVTLALGAAEGGYCRIVIDDQGPGVRQDELVQIFTPFFRGAGGGEGYGLGLAIARRVLLAVNGRIDAENLPAGGLRVVIEMPAEIVDAGDADRVA